MSIEMYHIFKNIGFLPKIRNVANKPIFDIIRSDREKPRAPSKALRQERCKIQEKLRQTT